MSTKVILNQSFDYAIVKLKQYLRSNKLRASAMLIFFAVYCFGAGIAGTILFLFSKPSFSFRSLLAELLLLAYIILLLYFFLTSAFGTNSPFLKNKSDLLFHYLVPVDPFVSYFSTKIYDMIRDFFLTLLACLLLFGPLMLILNTRTAIFRLLLVMLNLFLEIEFIMLLGNIIFFLLQRFRKEKNLEALFTENLGYVLGTIALVPIVGFIYLLINQELPTYSDLQIFYLIPLVNNAIGTVGFFFRSGIPDYSYVSLVYSIMQVLILLLVNTFFIKKSFSTTEIGNLMPIFEYNDNQRQNSMAKFFQDTPIPSIDKVETNVNFYSKKNIYSLIKKEWLLIKRIDSIIKTYFFVWFLVVVLAVIMETHIKFTTFSQAIVQYLVAIPIALELGLLITIYQSIKTNKNLALGSKRQNLLVKLFYSVIFVGPFFLILVVGMNIESILFILVLILIAEICNRLNLNSLFLTYMAGLFMFWLFTGMFLT